MTDFAVLERDVVPSDKAHARTATLEPDASNGQVLAIHELDIIVPGGHILWMCEHRLLLRSSTNGNGPVSRAPCSHGPAPSLRIGPAVQDQFVPRSERIGQGLECLLCIADGRMNFIRDTQAEAAAEQQQKHNHTFCSAYRVHR